MSLNTTKPRKLLLINFNIENFNTIQKAVNLIFEENYSTIKINRMDEIPRENLNSLSVFLIFIENDNLNSRKLIWVLKTRYPQVETVICSENISLAQLAWQINASFFLHFPVSRIGLTNMIQRVEKSLEIEPKKIRFNLQGGFELISASDICFCKGDGNYTTIYLKGDKKIVMTKKIKEMNLKFAPFPFLVRVGKSFIVNLENILKVDESSVSFCGYDKLTRIELSQIYLKRIKEQMLWYSY